MMEDKKKVLLVEDEEKISGMYRDVLLENGFEVLVAETVRQGLEKAKIGKIDLILLDILLPEESGIAFLRKLRKSFENIEMPVVVVVSNYSTETIREEAFSLGVKDYLLKTDFTPQSLVEKIKEYL